MHYFFLNFSLIFYFNLICEMIVLYYGSQGTKTDNPMDYVILIGHILYLSFYSYYSIANLFFKKDLAGLTAFVIARVELIVFRFFLQSYHTNTNYDILISFLHLSFYIYLYMKWDVVHISILRSCNRKIGADTSLRKLYTLRCIYIAFQSFTSVTYIYGILFAAQLNPKLSTISLVLIYLTILPLFFSLVVKRFETEKEDMDAKIYALCSYILCDIFIVLLFILDYKKLTTILKSARSTSIINLINFLILTLLCVVDYFTFGKGLKEAFQKTKSKQKF